jgi:hypothetical protein
MFKLNRTSCHEATGVASFHKPSGPRVAHRAGEWADSSMKAARQRIDDARDLLDDKAEELRWKAGRRAVAARRSMARHPVKSALVATAAMAVLGSLFVFFARQRRDV